jgi:hypothetical protein
VYVYGGIVSKNENKDLHFAADNYDETIVPSFFIIYIASSQATKLLAGLFVNRTFVRGYTKVEL